MNSNSRDFLRAILPDTGLYIAWCKKVDGGAYNAVFGTIEELAIFIESADANGREVYHACASYIDRKGVWNARKEKFEQRCQANTWGARALWADIDCGVGKSYAEAAVGANHVIAFARAHSLPPPLFVGSGYGLHCYWPLDTNLNPADWFQLASGFKAAAERFGLQLDPSRTTDIASVLRTPGTHNRKYGTTVPVVSGPVVGPYAIANFTPLVMRQSSVAVPNVPTVRQQPTALTTAITEGIYDPFFVDPIADACNQIKQLRDNNNRYGPVLEPLWYACVGVTAFCKDGAEKTHAWSSAHPNYSQSETDDRLKRVRQLSGATTCQKFQSINPAGCASCPHQGKITSPISLGRPAATTPLSGSPSTAFSPTTSPSGSRPQLGTSSSPLTGPLREALFGEPLPTLRQPWKWSKNRQLVMQTEKDGQESEILICNYPLYLDGVQVGEVGEGAFSYHFKQFLPHAGWINVVIPAEQLMGPGGIAKLFGKGVVVHEPRAFNSYVRDAVDTYNAAEKLRTRYDQFGWKANETAFLYGSRLYSAGASRDMLGSEEVKERSAWLRPKANGTLSAWSAAANALFQQGCEVQAFALLCSFAAPLMRFHTVSEGGAIVALHSRGSAKGKSTALAAVTSVWGDKKGLEITNTDTSVSKGITLGVLGNLPIVYDELQHQDPEVIRDFVRVFTNGRDKMRGTTAGTIRHTQASWQTVLITASNASLTDTLYHSSGIDALAFRVLELPATLPANVDTSKGDSLKKELEQNAGHAGDAYLRYLLQPDVLAWARSALEAWTAELWRKTNLPTEHRFRLRTLGSVAVAAALVNKLGLLAFDPNRIMDWAIAKVMDTRHDAPVTGHDTEASVEALGAYLSEHIHDTLVMPGEYQRGQRIMLPLVSPTRRLSIRYEKANGRLLLALAPLRAWLLRKEIGYSSFVGDLKAGLICVDGRRMTTLAAGTDFPGGQLPCLEVNAFHPAMAGVVTNIVQLEDVRRASLATVGKV